MVLGGGIVLVLDCLELYIPRPYNLKLNPEIQMSFPRYLTEKKPGCVSYRLAEEHMPLAGHRNGIIRKLIKRQIPSGQCEPYKWHISIPEALEGLGYSNSTIVIELKPNQENNMSLYEIFDIWGFSRAGWTPIMLRLSGLVVDDYTLNKADYNEFTIQDEERDEPIYEFLHLKGSVEKGKLKDTWNWPGPQPYECDTPMAGHLILLYSVYQRMYAGCSQRITE